MIYVSKEQLEQVEYLIDQSIRGNHILFSSEELHRALKGSIPFVASDTEAAAYSVEHHIERVMAMDTLSQKRAYLDGLEAETFDAVVRTYLNIVENNLLENAEVRH